jgi:hypothetical protein
MNTSKHKPVLCTNLYFTDSDVNLSAMVIITRELHQLTDHSHSIEGDFKCKQACKDYSRVVSVSWLIANPQRVKQFSAAVVFGSYH